LRYTHVMNSHNWIGDDGAICIGRRYNPSTEEAWWVVIVTSYNRPQQRIFEVPTVMAGYMRGRRWLVNQRYLAFDEIPF